MPSPSLISENPGPAVDVIAFLPAKPAPTMVLMGLDLGACLVDERALAAEILLHEDEDGRCRGDRVADEEVEAAGQSAESKLSLPLMMICS